MTERFEHFFVWVSNPKSEIWNPLNQAKGENGQFLSLFVEMPDGDGWIGVPNFFSCLQSLFLRDLDEMNERAEKEKEEKSLPIWASMNCLRRAETPPLTNIKVRVWKQ